MKVLLEIDHYNHIVIMLLFPLPVSPNNLQYLDFLLFQYLSLVVHKILLTLTMGLLLIFSLQLLLLEYHVGFLLVGHIM
jgi:hypothetical protein